MAHRAAGAGSDAAAKRRVVALGFAYPDAIDIRDALPHRFSHVADRGASAQTTGARIRLAAADASASGLNARSRRSQSTEGQRSPVGGAR